MGRSPSSGIVDGVFVVADLFRAHRGDEVLCGERVGDVEAGQPARLESCGVEVEHDLRRLAAERIGNARTLHRDQPRPHEVQPEICKILLGQSLAGQRKLDDRHRRGAVVDDQRRSRAHGHLLQQTLRNRGDLCVCRRDVDRRVKEDLHDAEGVIGIRLEVLDVVDRRGQCALERGDDSPRHLVGRQALVLKGDADDRDVDARKDVDRHAHRGERAHEKNEQGRDDERVGAAQRDTDYCEHGDSRLRQLSSGRRHSARCGGAMNSGPTGSVIAAFTMRSMSVRFSALSDQPATPSAAST